eukprot:354644-Chlamydomonas_euryale.AAC.3
MTMPCGIASTFTTSGSSATCRMTPMNTLSAPVPDTCGGAAGSSGTDVWGDSGVERGNGRLYDAPSRPISCGITDLSARNSFQMAAARPQPSQAQHPAGQYELRTKFAL